MALTVTNHVDAKAFHVPEMEGVTPVRTFNIIYNTIIKNSVYIFEYGHGLSDDCFITSL